MIKLYGIQFCRIQPGNSLQPTVLFSDMTYSKLIRYEHFHTKCLQNTKIFVKMHKKSCVTFGKIVKSKYRYEGIFCDVGGACE